MGSDYTHFWLRFDDVYPSGSLLVLGATLAFVGILALFLYRLFFSPLASVPGPWYAAISEAWITSHLLRLRRCRTIDDLFKIYGPIVRVAPNKIVFLDPSTTKHVYSTNSRLHKSSFYKGMQINDVDHAMTILEPVAHGIRRKAFAPHYTSANLSQFQPELHDCTLELLEYLDMTASYPRLTHDLLSLFRRLLSDVNCVHLLGYRNGSFRQLSRDNTEVDDFLSRAIHDFPKSALMRSSLPRWIWNIVSSIPNKRWRLICTADKILHDFAQARVIETRKQYQAGKLDSEKMSLLERLLTREQMEEKDIICEVNAHFIAGTDTTATTLSYILWELSRRPDVSSRLRAELDEVMPDPRRIPDIQVLHSLPYLTALITEGLRIYSAVPSPLERCVPDTPAEPFTLFGHAIPKGTIIGTQAWSSHRVSSVFPFPEFFNPDRWLPSTIPHPSNAGAVVTPPQVSQATLPDSPTSVASETEKNIGINSVKTTRDQLTTMHSHMMPFGVGPRTCGGQNMAQMTLRVIIAAIARNFDIIIPEETNDQSMGVRDAFVIFPAAQKCKVGFLARK